MKKLLFSLLICTLLTGCQADPSENSPEITAEPTAAVPSLLSPEPYATPTPSVTPEPSVAPSEKPPLEGGFSYVTDINPNIRVELKYAGADNFTGSPVVGYNSDTAAIMTSGAANALSKVQEYLESEGLGLLIYDAYRPVKAVEAFIEWSKNGENSTKADFYPNIDKKSLFSSGYLASKSGHSLGVCIDLTLVGLETGQALDMGGRHDLLDESSWHGSPEITAEQAQNRKKLKDAMTNFGFSSYKKEWWHYKYVGETVPTTYFDFDVQ